MKRVIITGAGSGLGKELALLYANHDYEVILVGRSLQKLKDVQTEIGANAYTVVCDITNYHNVQHTIQSLLEKHQSIDMLINNAGVGYFGPLETYSLEEMNTIIDTNVKGTIFMTQACLSFFKKQQKGTILNIISTAGLKGKVNESVYVASKFAVRGFTESLQKEYAESPLHITAVYMGGMNTPFWLNSHHISDQSRLKNPAAVAQTIYNQNDGRLEIII
ncbi:SDR family oxidoreductase [Bacillus sp. HMF5848]|uniref:SDR family oxidoreductase n=1 Tax=Bacillus sp. HMF5848 TaxID=2495421 RepID=UPI000F7AA20A|nr:SDR family oxidoreductase [Bacillus sp. HMF5848]RSK29062.1 SDR family oxidoreductase [Bacillus sp. HMF5848]